MTEIKELTNFVANHDLLEETSNVDDLLDFTEVIDKFDSKLKTITKPTILGLVGPFGSGKSTMLHLLSERDVDSRKWIDFDAWKYPERKDLWEGFVLDFADQISDKEKRKTKKKVKGESGLSDSFEFISKISSAFPVIPGLNIISGMFNKLFKNSPATRVFELQEILNNLIKSVKEDLYIVVEDIDRSGDYGTYFLETLKQFIKQVDTDKKIVVIVPMGDKSYKDNGESYSKCIDLFEPFEPKITSLDKFVDAIFHKELFETTLNFKNLNKSGHAFKKSLLSSFFHYLLNTKINIRELKMILRRSDVVFKNQLQDGYIPDFRIVICLEAMKMIEPNKYKNLQKGNLNTSSNPFCLYLVLLQINNDSIYKDISKMELHTLDKTENLKIDHYDEKIDKNRYLEIKNDGYHENTIFLSKVYFSY